MDQQPDSPKRLRAPDAGPRRNVVAIGGSAGALDAMLAIVAAFPPDYDGNIFVVSHIGANMSHLPALMAAAGPLRARHPEDGEAIRPGIVYVAPPDRHMLVRPDHIRLSRGPRQHFTRPAIDPLFRSAAESFGPRVVGVVLSGTGGDGTAGLEAIREAGGTTVIQRPSDALYPEMPRSAAAAVAIDHVCSVVELPVLLRRLSSEPVAAGFHHAQLARTAMDELERPVALTCPECGGALREAGSAKVKEYRCHIGHRFSPEEVLSGQSNGVEEAVGVAVRVLNERIELCRQMAENARRNGRSLGVAHWQRLHNEADAQLSVLRRFLAQQPLAQEPLPQEPLAQGAVEPAGAGGAR